MPLAVAEGSNGCACWRGEGERKAPSGLACCAWAGKEGRAGEGSPQKGPSWTALSGADPSPPLHAGKAPLREEGTAFSAATFPPAGTWRGSHEQASLDPPGV